MSHELKGNLNNAINLNGSMQSSGNLRGQFQLGGGGGGTTDYNDLSNKPSINGHTLQGDSDTSDLELDYNDLLNLPVIPDMSGYYDKTETDDLLADKADKSQINYIWPAGEGEIVAQVDLIFDDETQEWVPTVTNINIPPYYSITASDALLADKADTADLATVAFSGDYDDLINKPVIPDFTPVDVSVDITITKTSGGWTIQKIEATQAGPFVCIAIYFTTSSTSAGSNGFVGTWSGKLPTVATSMVSYYSSAGIIGVYNPDTDALTVRVIAGSVGASQTSVLTCIYMTED